MEKEALISKKNCLKASFFDFEKTVRKFRYSCLFGVGKRAESWGYEFIKWLNLKNIIGFTDNNPDTWGKVIIDNLKCIPPSELVKYGKDMICIMLVQESVQDQISVQFKEWGIETIGTKFEWIYVDSLIEKYFNIHLPGIWEGTTRMGQYNKAIERGEKIAVYTCIVDGYDDLKQPLTGDSQCDYYCLGLEKPEKLGIYHWIDISDLIPEYLRNDYTRINRYCKIHPHILFPEYKYSVYVDGSITIQTEISHLMSKIGKTGFASYGMPFANDIYEHAASVFLRNGLGEADGKELIVRQMQRYALEGFPRFFGLTENGVLVRNHSNSNCIRIMNTWWNEVLNFSRRDQLSFMYAVWKNGFSPKDIGYIDDTFREGPEFGLKLYHNKNTDVKRFGN